jgi:hypothetical protein
VPLRRCTPSPRGNAVAQGVQEIAEARKKMRAGREFGVDAAIAAWQHSLIEIHPRVRAFPR